MSLISCVQAIKVSPSILNVAERKVGMYRDRSTRSGEYVLRVIDPTITRYNVRFPIHCSISDGMMDPHRIALCSLEKATVFLFLLVLNDHSDLHPYNWQAGVALVQMVNGIPGESLISNYDSKCFVNLRLPVTTGSPYFAENGSRLRIRVNKVMCLSGDLLDSSWHW
jgi:hypothetical protein